MQTDKGLQINPIAILAAVLFNINKTETVKIKLDDSEKEMEVESECVAIEREDGALVCVLQLEKVLHFQNLPYDFTLKIEHGNIMIGFEKAKPTSTILDSRGQRVGSESPVIKNLMERLING